MNDKKAVVMETEEVGIEAKQEEVVVTNEMDGMPLKYRYYCPSCTNTAFFAANKTFFVNSCQSCGKGLRRDESNYIVI